MSLKINLLIAILVLLVPSLVEIVQGKNSSVGSPWVKKVDEGGRLGAAGCWGRPWICQQSQPLGTRMWCCRNRCVDVSGDRDNCGLCALRCPFARQCCRGLCTDTDRSWFNCGRCGNRCPRGVKCRYGMCGYAGPWPGWPSLPWPQPPPQPCPPDKNCPSHPPSSDQPPPMEAKDL